jgi:competence protein ComGC
MKSSTTKVFVLVISTVIGLSIFTMTNSNVFAQQNGFTEEINLLNQTIPALENQDKNAKKTLFDVEGIMEDKLKDNPDAVNAEKRIEAAIKMIREDNFQAALDHTKEAIKSLSDLNSK